MIEYESRDDSIRLLRPRQKHRFALDHFTIMHAAVIDGAA